MSPHSSNDSNIYRYDINDNKYEIFCSYQDDEEDNPKCHGMFILPDRNELHIYQYRAGIAFQRHYIMDLEALKWSNNLAKESVKSNVINQKIIYALHSKSIYHVVFAPGFYDDDQILKHICNTMPMIIYLINRTVSDRNCKSQKDMSYLQLKKTAATSFSDPPRQIFVDMYELLVVEGRLHRLHWLFLNL